jgi:hypothetical protein
MQCPRCFAPCRIEAFWSRRHASQMEMQLPNYGVMIVTLNDDRYGVSGLLGIMYGATAV